MKQIQVLGGLGIHFNVLLSRALENSTLRLRVILLQPQMEPNSSNAHSNPKWSLREPVKIFHLKTLLDCWTTKLFVQKTSFKSLSFRFVMWCDCYTLFTFCLHLHGYSSYISRTYYSIFIGVFRQKSGISSSLSCIVKFFFTKLPNPKTPTRSAPTSYTWGYNSCYMS